MVGRFGELSNSEDGILAWCTSERLMDGDLLLVSER